MSPQKEQSLNNLKQELLGFFPVEGMFTVRGNDDAWRLIINRKHFNIGEAELSALRPQARGVNQIEFAGNRGEILKSAQAFAAASTKRNVKLEIDVRKTKTTAPIKRSGDRKMQSTNV